MPRITSASRAARSRVLSPTARVCAEALEGRRLLCGLSHEYLIEAPTFDWGVEHREAARLAREEAGVEARGDGEATPLASRGPTADEPQPAGGEQPNGGGTVITWSNRGAASDGFAAAYGASANAGRAVVDAVFAQWSRVISSWNRSDGTTTLQVNVSVSGGGFGAAGGPGNAPADRKPRTGSITLGNGNNSANANDTNGWFFDPTPMDNSEFLGTTRHAYNADATNAGQGSDLFSVVNNELSHVLGLIADKNNAGGGYENYPLEDFSTNTGIRDNAEGGGSFGFFYVFDGPNIDHLMTGYNSGDATSASWGNVVHTAGGSGNVNFNGVNYRGTDDEGNAIYNGAQRTIPSFVMARILGDAYGYSIIDPATFATMHTVLNQSSGVLTVRGSTSATSADLVSIDVSGGDLVVTVDVGEDTPGSGALPGVGNLPAYVTRVPLASVTSIQLLGNGGNDFLRVERNGGKPVFVNGGDGNDFIDFALVTRNLDTIGSGSISLNGGPGTDSVFVYDNLNARADTYTINSARFDRPLWAGFSYASDIEGLTLTTGSAADVVNIPSTFTGQPIFLNSAGGQDTVNVGNETNGVRSINAAIQVQNDPSFTTLNINDGPDTVARTATIEHLAAPFGRLSGLAPAAIDWDRSDVAAINVTMGTALDTLRVYDNSETLNINNAGQPDLVQLGDNRLFGNGMGDMTGTVTVNNSPSFTTLILDDQFGTAGRTATWTISAGFTEVVGLQPGGLIRYNNNDIGTVLVAGNPNADNYTFQDVSESTTVDTAGGNDTLTVNGTDSLSGAITVNTGVGALDVLNVNGDGAGVANARLAASDAVRSVNIGVGGRLTLVPGRDKAFSIDGGFINGVLDLNDNALITTQIVGSPNESYFRPRLINGYNGGAWNGGSPSFVSGIAAASAVGDGIGYGFNGQNGVSIASLYGLPVAPNDLILRYALNGDANLDGAVNFPDLVALAQNYNGADRRWSQGDFNYDGTVNFPDLVSLAQNYNASLSLAASAAIAGSPPAGSTFARDADRAFGRGTRRESLFADVPNAIV